jgi:cytochrome c oxidase subunit II
MTIGLGPGRLAGKDIARALTGVPPHGRWRRGALRGLCCPHVNDLSSTAAALVSTRAEYAHLFAVYVPIAAAVFGIVLLLVGGAVVRYRNGGTPSRRNDSTLLEGSYALLLVCIVGFLLYETFSAEHQVDTVANRERPSLTIDVTAARWEWAFAYPGHGITSRSGRIGHQPLVVPADRAIRFNLASQDVIHSMWIPALDFKRDLIPGYTEHVTLTFTKQGSFGGECAEFCGDYHSEMIFEVHVLSAGRFARWLASHRMIGAGTNTVAATGTPAGGAA